jgi:alpha-beta hydrolase superfamily lysophospholipase
MQLLLSFITTCTLILSASFGVVEATYVDEWEAYVTGVTELYDVQPDCMPLRREGAPGATYRGVVMLIHGFTACPQQYLDILPFITEVNTGVLLCITMHDVNIIYFLVYMWQAGFEVLVPLLPGHGGVPAFINNTIVDNIEHLPSGLQPFLDFSSNMSSIMDQTAGERAIIGLSLGGTTAAYAASLNSTRDPSRAIYTRQLIAVPLLALPQEWFNVALDLANSNPTISAKRIGWGEACEKERALGRQGNCVRKY